MTRSKRIVRFIETISVILGGHLMGWLLMVLMFMILVEVLTRYILQSPLSIAEEYGGYILVFITFLGLGYTWKERGHIRVELIINVLSPKAQNWLRLITIILAITFSIVMIKASYDLVSYSYLFGTRSGSWLRTPLIWPQIGLIIGSVLLFIQLTAEFIRAIMNLKQEEREV
ncbi:MAG: TRAP transporter small permease [Thermodesulfobacteriota bacterium]|nr:TRAP transporter small permease [Thermodesulfobacteriota bacterium]